MITSALFQLDRYCFLGSHFHKAIRWVLQTDLSAMEVGRYPIDGDEVFAIVNEYTTKPSSECDPESHQEYADIQIMIRGRENFGYAPLNGRIPTSPYDP